MLIPFLPHFTTRQQSGLSIWVRFAVQGSWQRPGQAGDLWRLPHSTGEKSTVFNSSPMPLFSTCQNPKQFYFRFLLLPFLSSSLPHYFFMFTPNFPTIFHQFSPYFIHFFPTNSPLFFLPNSSSDSPLFPLNFPLKLPSNTPSNTPWIPLNSPLIPPKFPPGKGESEGGEEKESGRVSNLSRVLWFYQGTLLGVGGQGFRV